jgi:hypothetical protein
MKRFLQDAANIFDAAMNVAGTGHPTIDTALLIGDDGSIRVICGSEWPLESLCRAYGTPTGYRVGTVNDKVTLDGRTRGHRCHIESDSPNRIARTLLGTNYSSSPRNEATALALKARSLSATVPKALTAGTQAEIFVG